MEVLIFKLLGLMGIEFVYQFWKRLNSPPGGEGTDTEDQ